MEHTFLAIIAGGKGMRLFPLSSPDCPKQFCVLPGGDTFIQDTVRRFVSVGIRLQNIIVIVTNDQQLALAKSQLLSMGVISPNILNISEDYGYPGSMVRAADFAHRIDANAVVVNTPSDQYIEENEDHFKLAVHQAIENAKRHHPTIVGVKVNDLNTFVGCGHAVYKQSAGSKFFPIDKFVEKPKPALAEQMMREDNSACNSGINVWLAEDLLAAYPLKKLEKRVRSLRNPRSRLGEMKTNELMSEFKNLDLTVGEFGWHDCGTLKAYWEISNKTPHHHNASVGEVYRSGCLDSLFITLPKVKLFATGIVGCAVVVNVIRGKLHIVDVDMDYSQQVKELAEKFYENEELLTMPFAIYGAINNSLIETNLFNDVCCSFVGPRASGHQIVPMKLPNDEIIIQISARRFDAQVA